MLVELKKKKGKSAGHWLGVIKIIILYAFVKPYSNNAKQETYGSHCSPEQKFFINKLEKVSPVMLSFDSTIETLEWNYCG